MGTVYVIQHGDTDLYKIGYTAGEAGKRLSALQVGNPVRLALAYQFVGTKSDEEALQEAVRPHRERGEWYRLPRQVVESVDQWTLAHTREPEAPYPEPRNGRVARLLKAAGQTERPARNRAIVLGLYDLQHSPRVLAKLTMDDHRALPFSRVRRAFGAVSSISWSENPPLLPLIDWSPGDGVPPRPTTASEIRLEFRRVVKQAGINMVATDVSEMTSSRHPNFRASLSAQPCRSIDEGGDMARIERLKETSASNCIG